ncbi:TonB-dependent receptor [Aquabacterium humicola]|uniref:TonB-dependent receptor n=1 Tax=Aquabacterium humicola TaxID=3237377 RepID=UPI0025436E9E|nr:TonB-dependent receptor [Rubrivivax pictus]
MEPKRCRGSSVALVALLFSHATLAAAQRPPGERFAIESPAQPLADSLRSIARQTGMSILFDPGVVSNRVCRAFSGRLTGAEAVARALDGTGLTASVMEDGSVVVRAAPGEGGAPDTARPGPRSSVGDSPGAPDAAGRLAQAPSRQAQEGGPVPTATAKNAIEPTKIEITGSRIKRIESEGPLPVNVYGREDLLRSGQPTLERFLSGLNEASVSAGEGGQSALIGQGSVQLRGMPVGSTLVMINGRRVHAVGSSSANFFNLNLIPITAIERIEIVPVGSSAIYGGDALAGVVNVILRKSIDGFVLDARMGSGKGIGDGSISFATGGGDAQGSFVLIGSHGRTTPLMMAERSFFRDMDYRRFGGPDARTRNCAPGTVTSGNAGSLPGLNASLAGIPRASADSPLTISDFLATAGQPNLCSTVANGNGFALVHETEDTALHAAGQRRISQDWSVFGELTFNHNSARSQESALLLNNVLVGPGNPHNPFGAPVRVTARLGTGNGMTGIDRTSDFTRAVLGVQGGLGSGWDVEAALSSSIDDGTRRLPNDTVNAAARTSALASADPSTALNPFTTGRAASDDVLHAIWSDTVRDFRGRKDIASVFATGTTGMLLGTPVEVVAGAEASRDRYETSQAGPLGFRIDRSRSASAVFGEVRLPLLRGQAAEGRGRTIAALTLAGRRDNYSDFGGANTWQAGLEFRPLPTALIRAAGATSFKPPTLLQTGFDTSTFTTELFGLVDPALAGAPIIGGEVVRGPNPGLKPERGRALSLGGLWEPDPGLRLGLSAWRVRIKDMIATLAPQSALDHEALFPGFVLRQPSEGAGVPGAVTRVLYSEVNFGRLDTAGVDLEASASGRSDLGKWTVAASATRTIRYDVMLAPGSPVEHRLGRRATDFWSPRWKGRLSAALDLGAWSLALASRHVGTYLDIGGSGRELGGDWVHDLSATLDLKRLGLSMAGARSASLTLGILNLADRQPDFVGTHPHYDVTQSDWRGRYGTARLTVNW